MCLCASSNLTLIVKVMEIKGIIDIENNRIVGTYGDVMDSLLDPGQKKKRDCKLIGTDEFGSELPNGTYTGALGLLQSKKGDLFLSPSTQYFYKNFIEHSEPVYSDKFLAGQRIDSNLKSKETDLVTILNVENNIKLFLFLLTIVFILILILLNYLTKSKLIIIKLIENLFKFKLDFLSPVTTIGFCLIFYQLFYMLFKLIISNQISTSKVLVDTNYIINTMDRLLETKSVVCWIKNDVEIRMAEQSPKGSNMRHLFDEKKYPYPVLDMEDELSEYCLLSLKKIQTVDLTNKVLFINEATLYAFLASFVAPNPDVSYWISPPLFESVSVYYQRKDLSFHQKKEIDKNNQWKLQNGLSVFTFTKILTITTKMIGTNSKYYTDLKLYIDDNTLFTNLQISFVRRIFIIFFSFNFLIFFIYLIQIFLSANKKKLSKLCKKRNIIDLF